MNENESVAAVPDIVAIEDASLMTKVRNVMSETGESWREMTLPQKSFLGATALGLAFEWGTGNEAFLGMVGGNVYDQTGNVIATGVATGVASFFEQSVLGVAMALNIKNMPGFTRGVRENFFPWLKPMGETTDDDSALPVLDVAEDGDPSQEQAVATELAPTPEATTTQPESRKRSKLPLSTRFLGAFMLGASAVVVAENINQELDTKENLKIVPENAALIGAGVTGVGLAAAGLTKVAENSGIDWLAHGAEITVDWGIRNPLAWAGLFAAKLTYDWRKRRNTKTPVIATTE